MDIVPAPGRQFRTYTMILAIVLGSFDSFFLLIKAFSDLHMMEPTTALAINAIATFVMVPLKLIQQNLAVTTAQKEDLIQAAAKTPVHTGQADIAVILTPSQMMPLYSDEPCK
jgi:hypothetical protein